MFATECEARTVIRELSISPGGACPLVRGSTTNIYRNSLGFPKEGKDFI
jgi:hypothetical protein